MNQRSEFVLRAMESENFRDLCREYGISAKTGYKWKQRFMEEGLGGMGDQSRRPASMPGGLPEAVVCELIYLKQKHSAWGARKIRELYARKHAGQAANSKADLTPRRVSLAGDESRLPGGFGTGLALLAAALYQRQLVRVAPAWCRTAVLL